MQYLIRNNWGVFFIGFFIAIGDSLFYYESIASIIGFSLMVFSFYLMNLKSKQKK